MIDYELFRSLMEQARTVLAFIAAHTITWEEDDDRNDELRAADFVAWRAGYTATTTPSYSEVVVGLEGALTRENRRSGAPSRVDQAPEWTP